jgi:hypothetical protein
VRDDSIRELRHKAVDVESTPDAVAVAAVSDRIGVGGGDENVGKLQLAARWSEQFAPEEGDTLDAALQRFRRVYNFVDSVTKLVDPEQD